MRKREETQGNARKHEEMRGNDGNGRKHAETFRVYSLGVYSLGVYSLGVDYISFIAIENVAFFDLVDYISFIATENVAFFDLVDYISFIALGVYSVGVYSVGVYYLGQPIWDLKNHMPVLKKRYRGPFNQRLLFRELS